MTNIAFGLLFLLAAGQSINFFSLKQDIEIGSESATEAEQSLSLLPNTAVPHRFISGVGRRVAQNPRLPPLNYRFRIINSKDVNSAGFPGGAIYIHRGLLEIASTEDEVAAILAHEVSHVASRHGTAQLSRQLLVQAPIAIAAGLPASQVWRDEITKLGIAIGLDAPFLRYSRDQELEAGLMAVRLLAEAQYDPNAFRTLLEKIGEAQTGDVSRAPSFVFNHPQSQTVSLEITDKIDELAISFTRPRRADAEFRTFRAALLKLPVVDDPHPRQRDDGSDQSTTVLPNIFTDPMDYYRLGYPAGWQVTRTGAPHGAIIAPADGVQSSRSGDNLNHGVMFDLFDISVPDKSLTLEQATNRLIVYLRQRNPSLRVVPGAQTQTLVSDEPGLRTVLIGKPDASSDAEVTWVVTRLYYQSLFYMVFVAPEDEFPIYQSVFEQMIRSARLR
jgi:Zn-dependent protease with chaperone function